MELKFWIWIAVVVFVLPFVSKDTLAACPNKRGILPRQSVECGRTYAKYHHHHHVGHSHNHTHRVSGGYTAKPGEFPSFVTIRYVQSIYEYFCGGSLISSQSVLTAAHCVDGRDVSQMQVATGISGPFFWQQDGVEIFRVSSSCVSPYYQNHRGDQMFDFAVLLLDRPVRLSQTVQPACLPEKPINNFVDAYSIGIGYINLQHDHPRYLQVLPVRRIGCPASEHDESRICFAAHLDSFVGDTCGGDSGGPIIATVDGKQTIYGLTSYGSSVCQAGRYTVSMNANVWKQRKHIQNFAQNCIRD